MIVSEAMVSAIPRGIVSLSLLLSSRPNLERERVLVGARLVVVVEARERERLDDRDLVAEPKGKLRFTI